MRPSDGMTGTLLIAKLKPPCGRSPLGYRKAREAGHDLQRVEEGSVALAPSNHGDRPCRGIGRELADVVGPCGYGYHQTCRPPQLMRMTEFSLSENSPPLASTLHSTRSWDISWPSRTATRTIDTNSL